MMVICGSKGGLHRGIRGDSHRLGVVEVYWWWMENRRWNRLWRMESGCGIRKLLLELWL